MTQNTGPEPGATYAPPPTAPSITRPPLRRSRTDRVLGGVAAGFARWLNIDPVIVRVVLVVLAIFGGSGLLLYAAGWLFIPDEGEPRSEAEKLLARTREPNSTGRTILIVAGVVIGVIVLAGIASSGPFGGAWGGGGWLLLLATGGLVLWLVNRPPTGTAWGQPPAAGQVPAPGPVAAPLVSDAEATTEAMAETDRAVVATVAPSTEATTYDTTGYAYGGYGGYPGYVAPVPTPIPPRAPKPRSYLGLATLSLSVMTMGVLGALQMSGAAHIPLVVVLAAGLGVLGLGLLVGAFAGRARWLIALALPLLLVTAVLAFLPSNLHLGSGMGERAWAPTTPVAAAANHHLGIGSATLDLTDLALPPGSTVPYPVRASVGVGELLVTVPADMNVNVVATVRTGEIAVEGLPRKSGQDLTLIAGLPGGTNPSAPTIDLIVDVAIGNLEVSRA